MARRQLWLLAAVMLCCTGLCILGQAQQANQTPALPAGVQVQRNLEYVPGGHERHKLDLYLPEKADGPRPLIVWVHGGGWQGGNKERCPATPLVTKGYAVASINYRLSQHAKYPAQIEDCKAAIRWLRAHADKYHFDKDRIGVWGASAGGHLVALLGATGSTKELDGKEGNLDQSSRVQAVVDWFGPTDLIKLARGRDSEKSPIRLLLGGPIAENKEKAERANPITFVSKETAPFLIMHGDQDKTVPLNQSELLVTALKKAGVEVTMKVVEGSGHGGPAFLNEENKQLIQQFFDKHLKKGTK
jgi:acetyl esterase/lipase